MRSPACLTLMAALSLPAQAQPPSEIEEIIVRGELLERSLQDTQTGVSVITGEQLDRSVDKDLFDVIDRTPGANAQGGGFGFVIRGVTSGGVGGGSAPTINVEIDGANVPTGQALRTGSLSTWDLEQVEVLRGPRSTQQGRSSLAGAIIMRSKDPGFEREAKLRGDYGSFDETRLALAGNLPLNDQWAVRLTYEDYESDGDIENTFTGEDNATEALETIRGKLRFRPNDRFDAALTYTHSNNRLGNQSVDDMRFPDDRVAPQASDTEGTTNTFALMLEWAFGERWDLVSETSHLESDYEPAIGVQPLNPANTPGGRTVDDTAFTQEVKVLYQADRLTGVFGAYCQKLEKDLFFRALIPNTAIFGLPPGSAVFGNTFDLEIDNMAVFGEATYEFSEHWTLVLGLRGNSRDEETLTRQFSEFTPDPFGLSASGMPVELDADYSAILPKLSAICRFNEGSSLGFAAQRAYRAGGASTDFTGAPYEFDPEYSNNYELAYRSLIMDGNGSFNVNLYLTDYTDMQVGVPGPSGLFVIVAGAITNFATPSFANVDVEGQGLIHHANLTYSRTSEHWDLHVNLGFKNITDEF